MIQVKLLSTDACYDLRRADGNLIGHFVLNTEKTSYVFLSEPEIYMTENEMTRLSEQLSRINLTYKEEKNKC